MNTNKCPKCKEPLLTEAVVVYYKLGDNGQRDKIIDFGETIDYECGKCGWNSED